MAWPACRLSSSPQPLGRSTYLWRTPATTFLTSLNIAAKRLWRLDWPRPSTIMRVLVWPEAPQLTQDILPFLSGHIAADTKYHGEWFLFFYCLSGLRLLNPKSQSMCFLGSVVNSLFEKSVVGDRPKKLALVRKVDWFCFVLFWTKVSIVPYLWMCCDLLD